jgi:hypothetical protein
MEKQEKGYGTYRFDGNDSSSKDYFFKNGFFVLKSAFPSELIKKIYAEVSSAYIKTKKAAEVEKKPLPFVGIIQRTKETLEESNLVNQLYTSENLLNCLEGFLGPDLAKINANGLFINDPDDNSPVTNKACHQDIWTGASVDDIIVWIPFNNVERENTVSVVPGSHYYGILPNRNREILPLADFSMPDPLPIVDIEPGDALLFHTMLVHKTSGRGSQIRYAMHFNMRNSNAPLTKQQQAFGYIGIRQGVMTKIRAVLGNDHFTPLRTYGGKSSNFEQYTQKD